MAQRVRANIELKMQNYEAARIALLAARDGFGQCNMRLYRNTAEAKLCEISGVLKSDDLNWCRTGLSLKKSRILKPSLGCTTLAEAKADMVKMDLK